MDEPVDIRKMVDQLMAESNRVFDLQDFDRAYHLLSAATHLCEAVHDQESLNLIASQATRQLSWIDESASDYKHSTESSGTRFQPSIFAQLAHTASLAGRIAMHQQAKEAKSANDQQLQNSPSE
jgi:hypothetical protein